MATFKLTQTDGETLIGGDANDVFTMTLKSDLDGTDTVMGQGGLDTILVNNDGNTISDSQFAGVSGVETLAYAKSGVTVAVQIGDSAAAAGLKHVDAHLVTDSVLIDASGHDTGGLVIDGGGATNNILGSALNDVFRFSAATFDSLDVIDGGGHAAVTFFPDLDNRLGDVLQLASDEKSRFVADVQFGGVTDVQTLALSGKAGFDVTVAEIAAAAGIRTVDASAATGAVKIDVSALEGMTVDFTSKGLTAADTVIGRDDTILGITDKAAVLDAALKGVTGLNTIAVFGDAATPDFTGAKITLGANSQTNGITDILNLSDYGLTVDASARTSSVTMTGAIGNDVLVASQGTNDSLDGQGGDDSLRIKLASLNGNIFDGGTGTDEIRILDSSTNPSEQVEDSDFNQVSSVERLVFDGTGIGRAELGAKAAGAGLQEVDGSKASALIVDATSMTKTDLKVTASNGTDNVLFGGGVLGGLGGVSGELFMTTKQLGGQDAFVAGGKHAVLHFTDAIKLSDTYFTPLSSGSNLTGFDTIDLDNGAAKQSLIAGASLATFLTNTKIGAITATSTDAKSSFTFDFSKLGAISDTLKVTGGAGNDTFIGNGDLDVQLFGGDGDDTFSFASGLFGPPLTVNGGQGTDTLLVTDAIDPISDNDLDNVAVDILRLAASKGGPYQIALGSFSSTNHIDTVDASQAGVDVTITSARSIGETLIAGAKSNKFTGSSQDDTFKIAAGTFNAGDVFDGGVGSAGNTLEFTTGGAVGKGGKFLNIGFVQLSDAGNSFKLADVDQTSQFSTGVTLDFAGSTVADFNAIVNAGKGNDTVDLSAAAGGSFAFVSSGGNDSFTGGHAGGNTFAFTAGTLTAADKVIGQADSTDLVRLESGVYNSDQFKGFKSVEILVTSNADPSVACTITVKNDFFANADAGGSGLKSLQVIASGNIADDVVDGSGITGALNGLTIQTGSGDDTLIGGAGRDNFSFGDSGAFLLDQDDRVAGGGGSDRITLTTDTTRTLNDVSLTGVSSVEEIFAATNSTANITLNLGLIAGGAGIDTITQGDGVDLTVNANGYADFVKVANGLTVNLGKGDATLTLSGSADTVVVADNTDLDGSDKINGFGGSLSGKVDRIVFQGSTNITDAQFAGVTNIPVVALEGKANNITLGSNADANNITTVDASQARSTVIVDAGAMKDGITIIGSREFDQLTGGGGSDVIYGGGQDGISVFPGDRIDGGAGADRFVYLAVSDSTVLAGNITSHVDSISNLDAGDAFDLSAFQLTNTANVTDHTTDGKFTLSNAADFFEGNAVAVAFNGTDTFVYVDVNENSNFDTGADLFVRVAGDHKTDLLDKTAYIYNGQIFDPGLPYLGKVLDSSPTLVSVPPLTLSDAAIGGMAPNNILQLGALKGDWNLTLAQQSEEQGFEGIDARAALGKVTVNATDRFASVLIEAGKGQNILTGGHADDRFVFAGGTLDAKDIVDGGDGRNVLQVVGSTGKAGLLDAAFTNVNNVAILDFAADPTILEAVAQDLTGQKVVLGRFSDAAGITRVINGDTFGFGLTVDAGTRIEGLRFDGNGGKDVFVASQRTGVADFFDAGNGDDIMSFKLTAFGATDTFLGGLGTDEIHILDSFDKVKNNFAVDDNDFTATFSIERLVFDGTGHQEATLGVNAGLTGIVEVDASKVAGGLFLDATGMSGALKVIAGTGADTIGLGGSGSQVLIASSKFGGADFFTGNNAELHFTDAVKLTDKYFGGAGVSTALVGFGGLHFDNGAKGQSLTAAGNFAAFISNAGITNVEFDSTDPTVGFAFDFSKYVHSTINALTISGGAGNDSFITGASAITFLGGDGDDTFSVSSLDLGKQDIGGGDGSDTILMLDGNTGLVPGDFNNAKGIEILKFAALKNSTEAILGADATSAGIQTIDASLVQGFVDIEVGAMTNDVTILAGKKDSFLIGNDQDSTFVFDAKTLTDQDIVVGDLSANGDTLKFSTGGVVAAAAFGGVTGIEILQLSDAGNTVTLSDQLIAGANDSLVLPLFDGATANFLVVGGNGSDKVDLSQLADADKRVFVNLGTGKDQAIGGIGDDIFLFGDFTSADSAKGGSGHDTVMLQNGKYGADAFKGLTSIETIDVLAFGDSSVTLNNDAFKGADLQDNGTRNLAFHFHGMNDKASLDASAVTNAANSVNVLFAIDGEVTFIGGAGDDTVQFGDDGVDFTLDTDDSVNGGLGRDTIVFNATVDGTSAIDSDFAVVHSIERVAVTNTTADDLVNLTLAENAQAAGIVEVDASKLVGDLNLDATAYDDFGLLVTGGQGNDQMNLGAGDDTVRFLGTTLTGSDAAAGQGGDNTLELVGGATATNITFSLISNFQTLKLIDGEFDITFGNKATDFFTVDGREAGAGFKFTQTVANGAGGINVLGSDFADTIGTSTGGDFIVAGGGGDKINGGNGADTFVYNQVSDSFLVSLGDQTRMDEIAGFALGDTIALGNIIPGSGSVDVGNEVSLGDLITEVNTAFSNGNGVAVGDTGGNTFLFGDANGDGNFDFNDDIVIKVTGVQNANVLANLIF